jgi:hypothetical protein
VWVRTQRGTVGSRFVDLELAFGTAAAPELRVWIEIKHGADTHENQLENYLNDITTETQAVGRVVLPAPRGLKPDAPTAVPQVERQRVGRFVRAWCRSGHALPRATWLGEEFMSYLREEGLMDGERLSAAHAFELEARPTAERTVARLMEIAQAHVIAGWGEPIGKAGGANANFGEGWWASFATAPRGTEENRVWGKTHLEWTLRDDTILAEPRDGLGFFAGAGFQGVVGSPVGEAKNGQWFMARAAQGFEKVQPWAWHLWRVIYPDQLLVGATLEAQGQALADWVLAAFRELGAAPPLA